jgi:hypothetical protein
MTNKKLLYAIIAVIAGIFLIRRGKKKGGPKEWQEPAKTGEEKK